MSDSKQTLGRDGAGELRIESADQSWVLRVQGATLEAGLSRRDWASLERAWQQHFCLVFEGQHGLSTRAQVELLERFGPVLEERLPGEGHSYVTNSSGYGVDALTEGYLWGELTPHMDFTYTRFPADVISLFAQEIPVGGTSTLFYSNASPLQQMPEVLLAELRRHTIRCGHDLATMTPDARPYLDDAAGEGELVQTYDWPLIREHPARAKLEVLYCSLQQTLEVLGLPDAKASRDLLERLFFEYLYTDENRYEHHWRAGDLVLWDNGALQHARRAISRTSGPRVLRRVSVCRAGNGVEETVKFMGLKGADDAFGDK